MTMMTTLPSRPLRLPTHAEVLRAFNTPRELPPEMRQFMAAIRPMVDEDFIMESIASLVAAVGSMRPDRKIKHLDKLLSEINFPRNVVREINDFVDNVSAPPEYGRTAERIVPPLENLTGAILETGPPFPVFKFTEPMSELQSLVYDEAMTSFTTLRDEHIHHVSYSLFCNDLSPDFIKLKNEPRVVGHIIKRIEYLDFAAGICGVTLHNPDTWEHDKVDRMKVIATLNDCKSRDDVMQQMVDDELDVSPPRHVLSIVDDLIIDYCQRTVRRKSRDLRPLAFWLRVLSNSPFALK